MSTLAFIVVKAVRAATLLGRRTHRGEHPSRTDIRGKLDNSAGERRAEVGGVSGDPSRERISALANQRSV